MKNYVALILLFWTVSASARTPVEEAWEAELVRARREVADQVQLSVYDLLDELVYRWTVNPPFAERSPVVLAGVSVPVGLGTGLQVAVENHLAGLLIDNPTARLELVHCPRCTELVVRSSPEGTVVSRGYDDPALLAELGRETGKYALFIDVEAEGSALVLRARLTRLNPELPIVWSHALSTSTAVPALLREGAHLKSAADARQEYVNLLEGRGVAAVPLRIALRTYAMSYAGGVPAPPLLWVQSGVELSPTRSGAWSTSMVAGVSYIPQAYQGLMAQARLHRLLSGRTRSLTRPDLYLFGGVALITVWGAGAAAFQYETPNADAIASQKVRESFAGLHLGLELRLGNRISAGAAIEHLPSLAYSANIGEYTTLLGTSFQSVVGEVTFWF